MSISELKAILHQEIDALQDPAALELLHEAASSFSKAAPADCVDVLTGEQMARLEKSLKQADEGNTIPHAEALKQIKQWRSK